MNDIKSVDVKGNTLTISIYNYDIFSLSLKIPNTDHLNEKINAMLIGKSNFIKLNQHAKLIIPSYVEHMAKRIAKDRGLNLISTLH
ncbi:hypothetical protein [Pantoea sp. SS70]|uniref:hypothetical protein n=1 Tax=Pantoea sp. SS70 TaxID=3024247 RepID=UPI002452DB46|nr:hypothetical protein [Pantoea sp. SS70]WGK60107.1 hypothetical protein PO881_23500 [Pantoea sp. SS70]